MKSRTSLSTVGLRLSRIALRVLRERGISAHSSVSLEHQHWAKGYVVRGVESGGAAGDVGHFVTLAQEDGQPAECFCPVETIGVNGPHAVVLAPVLVRAEMLRKASTYELLITHHRPSPASNGTRPQLESKILCGAFLGAATRTPVIICGFTRLCQRDNKQSRQRMPRLERTF